MKITRHTLLALAVVAGALLLPALARAADKPKPSKPGATGQRAQLRERLQDFGKDLDLTDQQKEQLKPIMKEQMQKLRELRQDKTTSRQEKLRTFRKLREESAPKIKEILTAEQYEKWQKQQQETRDTVRKKLQRKQK